MKKLFFLFLFPIIIYAGTTGKLAGTIKDAATNEPLIGANVVIEGTKLGAATDVYGNFVILNIAPGRYSIKTSFVGYETTTITGIIITIDQTTRLPITLAAKSIQTTDVIIIASTPLIQKDVTSSISVITREEVEALPVANFSELLSLQAGVVNTGSGIHIRGGRSNEVSYMVDGTIVTDPLLGGLAVDISNDAIQEMSMLSGTFNAEYGNALSGVVNIVTRDGTDKFSGKFESRTSEFGIKRYANLRENRVNGSLSGPIVSNLFNFFLSGESNNAGSYLPFGYDKSSSFFAKISTTAIPNFKLAISNRGGKGSRQSYNHAYKYISEQYLKRRSDSWQSSVILSHAVANNFFYDLRASYFNQGYYSGINKDTANYITIGETQYFENIGNGFEFYKLSDPPELTDSRTSTVDLKADAVWQMGAVNEIKGGFSFKKHWLKLYYIYDPKRNFPYKNDYSTLPFEWAGYLQDKIELSYLVINLGLRYDYVNANIQFREDPLSPKSIIKVKSRSQLSPRIGIAHPISDRTKLHFSYGHFFQNPDFQYLFENRQYDLNVREPLFGQPNLDAQRTISYEAGISHQFSANVALNLTAYYRDITGLIGTRYFFPFENGRYTGYTLYVNEDYANIKGFEVTLDVRSNKYIGGGFTYTYSVAKGNSSNATENYPGTQKSTQLYYLSFDRTHVFNVNATLNIPEDEGPKLFNNYIFGKMDFSVVVKASSGLPYTPSGRDIGFAKANSLRMPGIYGIDVVLGKEFAFNDYLRLRVFAEILNLTDAKNVLYVYGDSGEPDLTFEGNHSKEYIQDPSNFGAPRTIRLGFTFRFN